MDACPRCNAKNNAEAEKMCRPGEDDCPMTCCDDWQEALAELDRRAAWVPPPRGRGE
jgi:hypothetical protein